MNRVCTAIQSTLESTREVENESRMYSYPVNVRIYPKKQKRNCIGKKISRNSSSSSSSFGSGGGVVVAAAGW